MPNDKQNVQNVKGTSINGSNPADPTFDTNGTAATSAEPNVDATQEGKTPQSSPQTLNNAAQQTEQGNNPRPIVSQIRDTSEPSPKTDDPLLPQGADPGTGGAAGAFATARAHRDIV